MPDPINGTRISWLTDPKNLLIVALMLALMLIGTALIVGTYDVVHAPLPYELRSDAMVIQNNIADRITNDEKELRTTQADLTNHLVGIDNHLDTIDDHLDHLDRAAGVTRHIHHYHK